MGKSQGQQLTELSARQLLPKSIRTTVALSVGVVALAAVNIGLVFALAHRDVVPIAVSDTGYAIPLVPLDKSYVTESRVVGYTEQCMQIAFSHDFQNYKQTFEQATRCFTPAGVKSYAMEMQPLLTKLKEKRMVMSIAVDPLAVAQSGVQQGVYRWVVEGTVTIYMLGTSDQLPPQKFNLVAVAERVPLQENIRGVALSNISLSPTGV